MQTNETISSKSANSIKEAESLESQAQALTDAYNRVTSDPAFFKAIEKKKFEAMLAWAFMKMGQKRQQYLMEAHRDFALLCTLRVLATNGSVGQIVNDIPFELPLKLTGKRTGFIELLPQLYAMAAEYEKVCEVAKSAKDNVRSAAQFRLNLREKLERFAKEEGLQPPLTRYELDALIKNYDLQTLPSAIAVDYVGKRQRPPTSGANIKKLLALVRHPERIRGALGKYLKRTYLPPDFEAIKQSLTAEYHPFSQK